MVGLNTVTDYKDLLHYVGNYGHGVCTTTMLSMENREAFSKFMFRNPDLFKIFKGTHGDLRIISLTPKGMKKFEGEDRLTEASSWHSVIELALINAFLIENNFKIKYSAREGQLIKTPSGNIATISYRSGLPCKLENVDVLLATKKLKQTYLTDSGLLEDMSQKTTLPKQDVLNFVYNSYTPEALLYLKER